LDADYLNKQFREHAHRVLAAYDDFRTRWSHVHPPEVILEIQKAIEGKPLVSTTRQLPNLFPVYQGLCVEVGHFNRFTASKHLVEALIFISGDTWNNLLHEQVDQDKTIVRFDLEDTDIPISVNSCLAGFFRAVEHIAALVALLQPQPETRDVSRKLRMRLFQDVVRLHAWQLNLRSEVVSQRFERFLTIAAESLRNQMREISSENFAFEVRSITNAWSRILGIAGVPIMHPPPQPRAWSAGDPSNDW
jgi:hypothetical protein